jgi:hypothetical protein
MRVSELREALAVEPGTSELDPDNMPDIDFVLSVCAGLVVVDQLDAIVRLIHYTTQDYLDRTQDTHFPTAQTDITLTCITYLSFEVFLNNPFSVNQNKMRKFRATHPLLYYAVEYCLVHARGQPESDISETLLLFLASASRWTYMWASQQDLITLGMRLSSSRLFIASLFDLREIARHLILSR